jgi:hypothetical protein
MTNWSWKNMLVVMTGLLLVSGLFRAAQADYWLREKAFLDELHAKLEKLGPAEKQALLQSCPTPEITMITSKCLEDGETSEVTVTGKFGPGTKIFLETDSVQVISENLSGGTYKATVKVASGIGPQTASVLAISPCGKRALRSGLKLGCQQGGELATSNGWKITMAPGEVSSGGRPKMILNFFRTGEASPFEKREADIDFNQNYRTYHISISSQSSNSSDPQVAMAEMMKKMGNPQLSAAEREKLMAQMQKLQQELLAQLSNPQQMAKAAQEAQDKFGCTSIEMNVKGANLEVTMRCSEKVGTKIGVTGNFKPARK